MSLDRFRLGGSVDAKGQTCIVSKIKSLSSRCPVAGGATAERAVGSEARAVLGQSPTVASASRAFAHQDTSSVFHRRNIADAGSRRGWSRSRPIKRVSYAKPLSGGSGPVRNDSIRVPSIARGVACDASLAGPSVRWLVRRSWRWPHRAGLGDVGIQRLRRLVNRVRRLPKEVWGHGTAALPHRPVRTS